MAGMLTVSIVSMEGVRQWAGQQQQVGPVAGGVPPVLAQQEAGADARSHRGGARQLAASSGTFWRRRWVKMGSGRHGGLLLDSDGFKLAV
jgi:hypothetical protein